MCQTKAWRDNSLETRLWMDRQGHPWELGEQRGSGCTDDPQVMGVSDGKKAEAAQTSCSWEERDKERPLARRKTQDQRQHFSHGSSSWGCASPLISSRFPFHAQDPVWLSLHFPPSSSSCALDSSLGTAVPPLRPFPVPPTPQGSSLLSPSLKTSTGRAVSQSQQLRLLPLGNYLSQQEPDPFKVPEDPCLV